MAWFGALVIIWGLLCLCTVERTNNDPDRFDY